MALPSGITFTVGAQDLTCEDGLKLVHNTVTPGGFDKCTFTVCGQVGVAVRMGQAVRIWDSNIGKHAYVGLVYDIHKVGDTYEITADRSTRDQTVRQRLVYQAGTPHLVALQQGVALCENVFDGGITDPGSQFVANSNNMFGYTAEQMWNLVSTYTASSTTPLLWWVRGSTFGQQVVYIDYADLAARYFAEVDEKNIDETYSANAMITRSNVEWGNDQYVTISDDFPTLTFTRDRTVNASNNLTRLTDAQGLAGNYLTRFREFRSVNDSITLQCVENTVRIVPPLVVTPNDNWPLHLVEAGHGINLLNRPVINAPYNVPVKYVTATTYDWESGKLTLRCGDLIDLGTTIEAQIAYQVNRLFFGPASSAAPRWQNHPLADADLIPVFGPNMPGDTPPSFVSGIPIMTRNDGAPDSTQTPYGRVVHPDLIADEGLEANFNIPVSSTGFGGGIRVIPGTFNEYEIILGNSAGKVADTVVVEIYKDTTGSPSLIGTVSCTGASSRTAVINPPIILGRKDFILFKVTTAGATATWAAISLHAKKQYPGLKV